MDKEQVLTEPGLTVVRLKNGDCVAILTVPVQDDQMEMSFCILHKVQDERVVSVRSATESERQEAATLIREHHRALEDVEETKG